MIQRVTTRYNNKEFGSVFKDSLHEGPRYHPNIKGPGGLPGWADRRYPGNTNTNESSEAIFKSWDNQKMRRFQAFMDQFYRSATPWQLDWMERTAPNFKKQETDIVKCKMELIKRILKIKVVGAESMEDWILLFMYYDNELDLPSNIEQLIRPDTSRASTATFFKDEASIRPKEPDYHTQPPVNALRYPSNLPMIGFGDNRVTGRNIPRIGFPGRGLIPWEAQPPVFVNRTLVYPRGTYGPANRALHGNQRPL